jgi:hypothetical protein
MGDMGNLGRIGPDQNQNVNKTNGTQPTQPTSQQQNTNIIKQQHHDQQRISHEQVTYLQTLFCSISIILRYYKRELVGVAMDVLKNNGIFKQSLCSGL